MANVRRTSLNLDFEPRRTAEKALGTSGTMETVHRALEDVWRRDGVEAALPMAVRSSDDLDDFARWRGSTRRYP